MARSLKTVAAVRHEAAALYRQAKGGVVEAQLAGRLGHLLQLLVSISGDHDFETRPNGARSTFRRRTRDPLHPNERTLLWQLDSRP
jgi:hypothetical protein